MRVLKSQIAITNRSRKSLACESRLRVNFGFCDKQQASKLSEALQVSSALLNPFTTMIINKISNQNLYLSLFLLVVKWLLKY